MNNKSLQPQTTLDYDKGYKWLHWLMALLVILMFLAKFGFAQALTDQDKIEMLIGHSSIGSLLFILFVIRFSKRFILKSPRPHHKLNKKVSKIAKINHLALYMLLFYVPVTGYLSARVHELPVYWFGKINLSHLVNHQNSNFDLLRYLHELGVNMLIILVFVHISAAIYHKVFTNDNVMSSMLPSKK